MGQLIFLNAYRKRKRYRSRKGLAWHRPTNRNKVVKFGMRYPKIECRLRMKDTLKPGKNGNYPTIVEILEY